MKEWLLENFDASVIVAICGVIGSACTAIISLINASRTKKEMHDMMEKAKENGSYAICPKCSQRIPLEDLEFHLKDGALDNNLNGIDDSKE